MSDANVIQDTSLTLRSILEAELRGSGDASIAVTVDSPHRPQQDDVRVNLFLYNIMQDEGRRNSGGWVPTTRDGNRAQSFAPEPLALRLYYLVTAFAVDGVTEHQLLGRTMRALHKHRRIPNPAHNIPETVLRGTLRDSPIRAEHLQIHLLNLDVDTLQKIWGAQTEALRTSVAYEVEAVFLDADELGAEVRLVTERFVDVIPFPHLTLVAPEAARPGATVRLYGSGLHVPQPVIQPAPPAAPIVPRNLVRVWFDDVAVEPVHGTGTEGAMAVIVPAGLRPGTVQVRIELNRYLSQPVPFRVLASA